MTWPMPRLRLAPALLPPVLPYALAFGASIALAFLANTTDSLLVGALLGLRPLVTDVLPMAGELALLVAAGALAYGAALLALGERTLLREVLRLWRAGRVAAA